MFNDTAITKMISVAILFLQLGTGTVRVQTVAELIKSNVLRQFI